MQVCGVEVVRDFHNHKKPMFSDAMQNPEELPEWVSIYFLKKDDNTQRCNICENVVQASEKSLDLLGHLKTSHAEVIELHKNPDSTVGFRIEFLQLNVLNEDGAEKTQPVLLGEVCEGPTEEVVSEKTIAQTDCELSNVQYVLIPRKRKYKREHETRKRSWVWKYFDKLSTIIFRCNICNVVLSIKGCNTNNMNRHVRTRHPNVYQVEVGGKGEADSILDLQEVETPYAVKTEEITDKDYDDRSVVESPDKKAHRSWVWSYFKKLSGTQAQCKLCNRNISHGGNATGNMNRHIKMIHKEVYTKKAHRSWVWSYFKKLSGTQVQCKLCNRNISHGGNATGNMNRHIKMIHKEVYTKVAGGLAKAHRSWVWSYFKKLSGTQVQCKLCNRNISHGGNATGNMNRHIKMIHKEVYTKVADENSWVWKVFESDEDDFYSCKICQFKCNKYANIDKSVLCILKHLKADHGVVSGDQIITSVDCDTEPH
ncbi:uncharacterized protein LOC134655922 [Cydia amplana]|uniref:uncharacterized protein LOC134655922 n=1 Tax=Cydia amplana TaxID=1869771 RepID=UPI002FE56648